MIYLTKQQLSALYGKPSVYLKCRFNADDSSFHEGVSAAYKYEFGYLEGHCIYPIIQKTQGSGISSLECASLLATNGDGEWKLHDDSAPKAITPASPKPPDNPVLNLAYAYDPVAKDPFYPTHLFASHQMQRRQLVVFHPKWQVDLTQIASEPLNLVQPAEAPLHPST